LDSPLNQILEGNSLKILKTLPEQSVNSVVTSPPYYGLRDYGSEEQFGIENTVEEYTQNLVELFREVRRVLKDDGTVWVNLGDSYSRKNGDKNLIGIPWKVAFALQDDGWILRQDIIWHKPNPMPESVKDRCTKNHEYIFLLTKNPKYYFDYKSIKEEAVYTDNREGKGRFTYNGKRSKDNNGGNGQNAFVKIDGTRNKRTVWTITTKPYKGAHFATFPEDLIEPCVLAGTPENGVVLDPFMGSGTTAVVARKLKRNYIGIELNSDYIEIAEQRLQPVEQQHQKEVHTEQIVNKFFGNE